MKLVGFTELVFFGLIIFVSPAPQDNHSKVGERLIDGDVVRTNNCRMSSIKNEIVRTIIFNDLRCTERIETIDSLPVRVDKAFPNLIFYEAYRCAAEIITKNNFKNLRKLQALYLPGNGIKALDEDSFDDLTELKVLNLFGNRIEILPERIFQNLHEVKYIELGRNQITALNGEHFKNNRKLKTISLFRSQIKLLSPTLFDGIETLERVDLSGNVCIDKDYDRYVTEPHDRYYESEYKNFTEYLSEIKNDVTAKCTDFRK